MGERELLQQAATVIDELLEWVPCRCNWEVEDCVECINCVRTEEHRQTLARIEDWLETEDGNA